MKVVNNLEGKWFTATAIQENELELMPLQKMSSDFGNVVLMTQSLDLALYNSFLQEEDRQYDRYNKAQEMGLRADPKEVVNAGFGLVFSSVLLNANILDLGSVHPERIPLEGHECLRLLSGASNTVSSFEGDVEKTLKKSGISGILYRSQQPFADRDYPTHLGLKADLFNKPSQLTLALFDTGSAHNFELVDTSKRRVELLTEAIKADKAILIASRVGYQVTASHAKTGVQKKDDSLDFLI